MIILAILVILISVVLGFFILIQNPKGGGLQQGSSASSMLGVQRTGDFLEKGTWGMMIVIVIFSIAITTLSSTNGPQTAGAQKSKISEQLKNLPAQAAPLAAPVQKPAEQPAKK